MSGKSMSDPHKHVPAKRIIRPRKPYLTAHPILAVCLETEQVLNEFGEVGSLSELPRYVESRRGFILATDDAGELVHYLNSHFREHPLWQYRISPRIRESLLRSGKRKRVHENLAVGFVGFSGTKNASGKASKFHFPLDPDVMCGQDIDKLIPGDTPRVAKLMEWAKQVRDFCEENRLKPSATSGGLAAQLLKDKRFFRSPRRKIPGATNARCREALPGNHYQICDTKERETHRSVLYLDISGAHHIAAMNLKFPDPNTMMARGSFRAKDNGRDRIRWKPGTKGYDTVLASYGLLYCAVYLPTIPHNAPAPRWAQEAGRHSIYLHTNEVDLLHKLGGHIEGIIAAWTSPNTEDGLNRYAMYAEYSLEKHPEWKAWLKPVLHSTYGLLAARPRRMEMGYAKAKSGIRTNWPTRKLNLIPVTMRRTEAEREPAITNVVWRGMIEAETRKQAILHARELASIGKRVLGIYGDGIIIESAPLPFLPPDWRVDKELTGFVYYSPNTYVSREQSRMPGTPDRQALARDRRQRQMRAKPRPQFSPDPWDALV